MLKMNDGILGQSKKIQKEKRENEKFTKTEKKKIVKLFHKKVISSVDSMTKNSKTFYVEKFNSFIQEVIPLYVCFFILTLFRTYRNQKQTFLT